MPILVSDTSVIIDMERGSLLEDVFELPLEFAVPDLLFQRELTGELGTRLIEMGLRVEELNSPELTRATAITRQHKRLSTPDSFAFAIAESRGWTLLTGDGVLRDLAAATNVAVHGVLWLCDQLEAAAIPHVRLHAGLTAISAHPRCRLPTGEIQARLERFSS